MDIYKDYGGERRLNLGTQILCLLNHSNHPFLKNPAYLPYISNLLANIRKSCRYYFLSCPNMCLKMLFCFDAFDLSAL